MKNLMAAIAKRGSRNASGDCRERFTKWKAIAERDRFTIRVGKQRHCDSEKLALIGERVEREVQLKLGFMIEIVNLG